MYVAVIFSADFLKLFNNNNKKKKNNNNNNSEDHLIKHLINLPKIGVKEIPRDLDSTWTN